VGCSARAHSLLLSLQDVHDRSTAMLLQVFYKNCQQTKDMTRSLRAAMRDLGYGIPTYISSSGLLSCLSAKSLKNHVLVSFCPPIFFRPKDSLIQYTGRRDRPSGAYRSRKADGGDDEAL
jgi:CHAT domain-containing protein